MVYWAIFPTSYYLFGGYAEPVLTVSTLASLYFARRKRWWTACLASAGATLARPVGFLIAVPLAIEAWLVESAGVLAFACATKPTAWFILPFYAVYSMRGEKNLSSTLRANPRRLLLPWIVFALVMGVTVLPFLFWDATAFLDDVIQYPSGAGEFAYPIKSLGLGGIALALGWIPSHVSTFPFGVLQAAVGLPVLVLLCRYQIAANSLRRLWLSYGWMTLTIAFFSRVFNDNHLGFILSILASGLLSDESF